MEEMIGYELFWGLPFWLVAVLTAVVLFLHWRCAKVVVPRQPVTLQIRFRPGFRPGFDVAPGSDRGPGALHETRRREDSVESFVGIARFMMVWFALTLGILLQVAIFFAPLAMDLARRLLERNGQSSITSSATRR